mgnify:CR=1 FL=1
MQKILINNITMMKIGLIDIDVDTHNFPNLPLMKLSAWHKRNAKKIIKGGSGYHIKLVNGREIYDKKNDNQLPPVVEHIYPDYSLYEKFTKDTAYGFLTRGCPRGCEFCIVKDKEGKTNKKVSPVVYTIVNFDTTFKQDLERVELLKKLNMMPYIMIYNKENCNKEYLRLQRYVNNRIIFKSVDNYYKYKE